MERRARLESMWVVLGLTLFLLFPSVSLAGKEKSPPEQKNAILIVSKETKELVSANSTFGFKLYSQILLKEKSKNILISPSSIALALAMTYNGAAGKTKEAMAQTLEIKGMSLDKVNKANAELLSSLQNTPKNTELNIANSLWGKKGNNFQPEFLKRNKDFYFADINYLNFNDPQAPAVINKWVKDKTKGKIDRIVKDIDPQAVLFLINAVYFKGQWDKPFDKTKTQPDDFNHLGNKKKKHPFMHQKGKYDYYENKEFQAVSLPYQGVKMSMHIFLPAKDSSLQKFHQKLTANNWEQWLSQFKMEEGNIALPRFKYEYDSTLNEALKKLGMGIAFDRQHADFLQMLPPPGGNISEVLHKTFVIVNEEGTEAAAATAGIMRATGRAPQKKSFTMTIDRPFFFVIRDNPTGSILFMGSVVDPQE